MKTREALGNTPFDSCFTSPLPRALQTADIMWEGREGPVEHLPQLEEANLEWLQVGRGRGLRAVGCRDPATSCVC